jgi:hypothetical protein
MALDDLEANRRGFLSAEQATVVVSMQYATLVGPLLVLCLAGTVGSVGAMVATRHGGLYFVAAIALGIPVVALGVWGAFAIRTRARRRAMHTPIRAVDGTVSWDGRQWIARDAGGASLVTFALPPGPYRFYVHEGRIVGAESPLGPGSFSIQEVLVRPQYWTLVPWSITRMTALPVGDRATLLGALAQTLGFSPADLDANRRGALSPAQGAGAVVTVDGTAQFKWDAPTKITIRHYLVVGQTEIRIPEKLGAVVVPGLHYRVYRRACDGVLVSLEPV